MSLPAIDLVLPHSVDAERGLLGAILIDPEVLGDVYALVPDEGGFFVRSHQILYQLLLELIEAGQPITLVTVLEALAARGALDLVGGRSAVMDLMAVEHAGHAQLYARMVRERAMVRRLIKAGQEIVRACLEDGHDTERLIDHCELTLYEVSEAGSPATEAHKVEELVRAEMAEIERLMESGGQVRAGISSGFRGLDAETAGLHKGELVIVAARPSMGKTSFAVNVCMNVALEETPVAIFSLEVARDQLVRNMLCTLAEVNSHELRTGRARAEDYDRLASAASRLERAPLFINDTPALSVMAMRTAARRLRKKHGIGLIMVDYLQLMEASPSARREGRQQEVTEISRGLKALSRELEVPVIALAQLNRKVDDREDHRPRLSDLRESGSIEQEADLILFLYRPAYYDRENVELEAVAEVIIAKQRHGPTTKIDMEFIKEYQRFRDNSDWS